MELGGGRGFDLESFGVALSLGGAQVFISSHLESFGAFGAFGGSFKHFEDIWCICASFKLVSA